MTGEVIVQAIVSGLLMGMVYALIAAGLSLIFGLMEIVNFAHGEFLMLSMYVAFWSWALFGLDPLLSMPISIVLLALLGVLTYFLVVRKILGGPMLAQIFATFGLSVFLRGSAQFLWSPDYRTIQNPIISGRLELLGTFIGLPQLVSAGACLVAFGALYYFITRTETGVALQATAQDRDAAALMGINTQRMFALGWGLGTGCVGLAGALLATFFYIDPEVGVTFALIAYVTVALGGFGSIPGALPAGIIIGLVEIIGGLLIAPAFKYVVVFSVYLLVVFLRPQGLMGRF
jgi:branched-chain amino acid transport system permease protein